MLAEMISQNISKGVMVRHWLCRITGKDKTYFLEDNMSDRNLFNPTLDRTHQERMESAREILLTLVRKLGTTSILDVGCGLGAWLKVAMEAGIRYPFTRSTDLIDVLSQLKRNGSFGT